ncbi:MAG: flagellar assembly protein FliW [Halarsenatibacteraceae bacterium]
MQEIETREFGEIEIKDEDVIEFPKGIPGFPDEDEFVLLPLNDESPFIIMQSVNEPGLAFVTIEPSTILDGYDFELADSTREMLKLESHEDVGVLLIATIKDNIEDMTVNLAAPVVFNINERLGRQVILDNDNYPVRYRLQPEPAEEGVS